MGIQQVSNVTVLGTGTMGPGIALLFARAGYKVGIWGPDEDEVAKGESNFKKNVEDLQKTG